ncbi:hypothetical protein HAX54_000719, partial [Datura stramonium]|nr:hypothetical protein [Datura stramonium]
MLSLILKPRQIHALKSPMPFLTSFMTTKYQYWISGPPSNPQTPPRGPAPGSEGEVEEAVANVEEGALMIVSPRLFAMDPKEHIGANAECWFASQCLTLKRTCQPHQEPWRRYLKSS